MKLPVILLLALLGAPAAAQDSRVYKIANLAPSELSIHFTRDVTLTELAKLGFVEGRNLVVLDRVGGEAAMPRLVQEVLDAKVDAIIAVGNEALASAGRATKTVPIIGFGPDPLAMGFAASLARPGGNVTGVVILGAELDAKRLDLLHQAVPAARRIAALMVPAAAPQRQPSAREMRRYAAESGIALQIVDTTASAQYARAFADIRAARAEALVVTGSAYFFRDTELIARLALEAGLPTVCEWGDAARMGCMMGYGPNRTELRRRVAHYVASVLTGTSPGVLPIEIPTYFEFVINLKVARALKVTIPANLLARADALVE